MKQIHIYRCKDKTKNRTNEQLGKIRTKTKKKQEAKFRLTGKAEPAQHGT